MAAKFNTTKWSLFIRIQSGDSEDADEALNLICRNYWLPIYAWLRGNGYPVEESKDLTQGFFSHALNRSIFQKADQEKGRLRNLLLVCLKRYLADQNERNHAQKRAVQNHEVPIDFVNTDYGESCIQHDLRSPDPDPAEIFERRWARALLQTALKRLREEHEAKGKGEVYSILSPLLSDLDEEQTFGSAAKALGISEGAARVAFHRFKSRFRRIFREEVARTLLPDDDLEDEMQHLARALEDS